MTDVAPSLLEQLDSYANREGWLSRAAARSTADRLRHVEPAYAASQARVRELDALNASQADALERVTGQLRIERKERQAAQIANAFLQEQIGKLEDIIDGLRSELAVSETGFCVALADARQLTDERDEARADAEEWGALYSDTQYRLDARWPWFFLLAGVVTVSTFARQWADVFAWGCSNG